MKGTLFIIATPIGNLKDITINALETLGNAEVIACEDTRRTGQLLVSLGEKYPEFFREKDTKPHLVSYFDQNETQRIPEILGILRNDQNVCLVSDAGTPLISDPGFKLVRECLKEGVQVVSLPGPSSVIEALTLSGLPTDKFLFLGYPPQKSGHRKAFYEDILKSWKVFKTTIVFFEAPHKLLKTLSEMKQTLGDVELVLLREMTKLHEERREAKISEHLGHFQKQKPKGEFVLVLPYPS